MSTPIYWLTGDAVTTYNLTFLATYVLCGVAMFALVWTLTGNATASFLAGFAYAFAPYRASQIAHIQVLAAFWAPLSLLGLHRFIEAGRVRLKPDTRDVRWGPAEAGDDAADGAGRRWPWLALFAVCWMLQAAANGYFLVFFSVLVGFWVLGFVLIQRRWRDAGMIAAAAAVASLPLIPILLRFVAAHARNGLARSPEEIVSGGAQTSPRCCAHAPSLDVWGSSCRRRLRRGAAVVSRGGARRALCRRGLGSAAAAPATPACEVCDGSQHRLARAGPCDDRCRRCRRRCGAVEMGRRATAPLLLVCHQAILARGGPARHGGSPVARGLDGRPSSLGAGTVPVPCSADVGVLLGTIASPLRQASTPTGAVFVAPDAAGPRRTARAGAILDDDGALSLRGNGRPARRRAAAPDGRHCTAGCRDRGRPPCA